MRSGKRWMKMQHLENRWSSRWVCIEWFGAEKKADLRRKGDAEYGK